MARVFLSNETYNAATSGATINGAAGSEQVNVFSGTTGLTITSSVERVDLSGNIADYTFSSFGAGMTIRDSAGNIVGTVSESGGKSIVFADGALSAAYDGTTLSLGGVALTGTAAAITPAPAAIDATITSGAAGSTTGGTTGGTGQTFTLTTGTDISGSLVGSAGNTNTDGNDTFTGTSATFNGTDVLLGGAGTDTINIAATGATTAPSSMVGIENVNFNVTSFADVAIDADNIIGVGTTITVNNLQAGGTAAATVNNIEAGATVVAGTGVTGTFTVEADGFATINAGSASSVVADLNNVTAQSTITANSATSVAVTNVDAVSISSTSATSVSVSGDADTNDAATISAKNATATSVVALETATAAQVEELTLSGNGGAVTYDLDGTGDNPTKYTMTGDQNVTLVGTSDQFTGDTLTDSTTAGTTTLKIDAVSAAAADLGKIAADVIDLAHTTATAIAYDLKNEASVKLSATAGANVTLASDELATGSETATVTVAASQGTGDLIVTDFETLNLIVDDGAATTGTITLKDLQATAATGGVVKVSGADNLTLNGANATFLDASMLTGKLTATLASDLLKVTGGSGDDKFNSADFNFTVVGGDGTDTFDIATGDLDLSNNTVSMTGVEVIAIDSGAGGSDDTLTVTSTFITGTSYIVTGTDNAGANDTLAVKMANSATLDLSKLTVDEADVTVSIDVAATAGVSNNITGSNAGDVMANSATAAGAITVDGKAGDDSLITGTANDVITAGEGADTITGNAGADTINLTESTSATDTIKVYKDDSKEASMDVVTGFQAIATNGDKLDFDTDSTTAVTAVVLTAGTAADGVVGANTSVSSAISGETGTVTATIENGLVVLSGTDAGKIDTISEWVDAVEILINTAFVDEGDTVGFEFGGDTYAYYVSSASGTAGDATDNIATSEIVKLVGVDASSLATTAADGAVLVA